MQLTLISSALNLRLGWQSWKINASKCCKASACPVQFNPNTPWRHSMPGNRSYLVPTSSSNDFMCSLFVCFECSRTSNCFTDTIRVCVYRHRVTSMWRTYVVRNKFNWWCCFCGFQKHHWRWRARLWGSREWWSWLSSAEDATSTSEHVTASRPCTRPPKLESTNRFA